MIVGIYYRKLVFFGLIIAIIFGVSKLNFQKVLANFAASASIESPTEQNLSYDPYSYYIEMDLNQDGSLVLPGGKKIDQAVRPKNDYDELRLIVLDEPAETYQYAKIVVNLPKKVIKLVSEPQIIAVHGASPISAELEDGKQIVYEAEHIGQASTLTITAKFPKGYFQLSPTERVEQLVTSIPGLVWLIGGVILPPFALVIFLSILFGRRFQLLPKHTKGVRVCPPSQIPPAVVSVLQYGRVGPRVIMATLIDLARRGFIDIYNQQTDFVIYRRGNPPKSYFSLRNFEKILLEKMFLPLQKSVGSIDVEARIARHLFSRKISLMYLALYDEAQNAGYFDHSPARIHLRYRMVGIILFFLGLLGYLIFAVYAPDPKFVLFFWLAMLLLGVLIVNFAPQLTGFSKLGELERQKWLQFRNFLTTDSLIRGRDELFEQYLPYAVAMGVEIQWASRFIKANFVLPKWYSFTGQVSGIEGFVKSFIPIINYLGDNLDFSSEPLVR